MTGRNMCACTISGRDGQRENAALAAPSRRFHRMALHAVQANGTEPSIVLIHKLLTGSEFLAIGHSRS